MNQICPQCMSSHIAQHGVIGVDNDVACENCSWKGKESELVGVPDAMVARAASTPGVCGADQALEIARQMTQRFLTIVSSRLGKDLGLALVEAGFVGMKDRKRLARLIRAACLGAMRGVLEEASQLQQEEQS